MVSIYINILNYESFWSPKRKSEYFRQPEYPERRFAYFLPFNREKAIPDGHYADIPHTMDALTY